MNSSSVDEYSNTSDILNKMLPFNLVKNDAVIVYNNQDKLVYIKVTNILEKEMIPFPVTPNNFGNHKLKIPE
jgi:sensor domain CHASE-containing protein